MSLALSTPLSFVLETGVNAVNYIDNTVQETPPWKLVVVTTAVVAIGTFVAIRRISRISWNWEAKVKTMLLMVPKISKKVDEENIKFEESMEKAFFKGIDRRDICSEMPEKGWEPEAIYRRMKSVGGTARSGRNSGAYYIDDPRLDKVIQTVSHEARRTSPLHLELVPLIRQLEAEIVSMVCKMFRGDSQTVGNMTSCGSDSIIHAVYTARQRAIARGLGGGWEMVVPKTAHPAFAKAGKYFGIKVVRTEVYPGDHPKAYQADVNAMRNAINSCTIFVAGSLPGYPHGIFDPITSIGEMLEEMDPGGKIGLHVDCCLGGFFVPWMEEAGYGADVPEKFGFDVPRVTSISADTHKYGYAEKGSSVVLFRDHKEWRRHQTFEETEWPGGLYSSPTFAGSRSGEVIAKTWAAMVYMGKSGYVAETRKIIEIVRRIEKDIREDSELSKHLEVMGNPRAMVVAVCSKHPEELNIYDLKAAMSKSGWYLSGLQKPAGFHLCVTAVHGNIEYFSDRFISSLKGCLKNVLLLPPEQRGKCGDAAMYGSNQTFGDSLFVKDFAIEYWNIASRVQPHTFNLTEAKR